MFEWLDRRLRLRQILSNPVVPRGNISWQYFPAFMTFALLLFQLLSGAYLALHFGIEQRQFSSYIYKCHYLSAHMLVIFSILYIMRNLLFGTYQIPRELNWLVLMTIVFLIWFNFCLGSCLANNTATLSIFSYLLSQFPFVGVPLVEWLGIAEKLTSASLYKLFVLHSVVVPMFTYLILLCYIGLLSIPQEKVKSQNNRS